jgi:hypothetical protein
LVDNVAGGVDDEDGAVSHLAVLEDAVGLGDALVEV